MKDREHFPSVRLASAGFLSLLLLSWVGFGVNSSWQLFISPRHGSHNDPLSLAVAVGLSLLILTILIPVLWRGPRHDRWLAALLAIFPLSLFGVAAFCGVFVAS